MRSSPWLSRGVRVCWSRSKAPIASRATRSSARLSRSDACSTTTPRCSAKSARSSASIDLDTTALPVSGRRRVRVHLRCRAAAREDRPEAALGHPVLRCAGRRARHVGRVRSLHASRHADRLRARRARTRATCEARLADYERRLLTARASVPDEIRVRGDGRRSRWTAPRFSIASRRRSSTSTKATSISCKSASASRRRSKAARRSTSTGRSARAIRRRTCSTSSTAARRCSARRRNFSVRLDGTQGAACVRSPERARARADPADDAAIAAELLANEKERAEHVMLVDLGATISARSRRPAACTSTS